MLSTCLTRVRPRYLFCLLVENKIGKQKLTSVVFFSLLLAACNNERYLPVSILAVHLLQSFSGCLFTVSGSWDIDAFGILTTLREVLTTDDVQT